MHLYYVWVELQQHASYHDQLGCEVFYVDTNNYKRQPRLLKGFCFIRKSRTIRNLKKLKQHIYVHIIQVEKHNFF